MTYDVDTGRARLVGFPGLKAIGFEYEGKIEADEKHHGGLKAVFTLNPGDGNVRVLAVKITADPATGRLGSWLDFTYNIEHGDWLEVTELERGLDKDGKLILRIKHEFRITAEEKVYCNAYMKWNPDLQCFESTKILTQTSFLKKGVEQWLKLPLEVEYVKEYVKEGEICLKVSSSAIKEYKGLFLEVCEKLRWTC